MNTGIYFSNKLKLYIKIYSIEDGVYTYSYNRDKLHKTFKNDEEFIKEFNLIEDKKGGV